MPARTRRSTRPPRQSIPPAGPTVPPIGRADLAAYIAQLADELVVLARAADLRTLSYLIDMVRVEAEHQVDALAQINPDGAV